MKPKACVGVQGGVYKMCVTYLTLLIEASGWFRSPELGIFVKDQKLPWRLAHQTTHLSHALLPRQLLVA